MEFDLTTFLFELVNFGLLLWILQRVLYRPLREGIETRRKALAAENERATAAQRGAEALRKEAEVRLADIEKLRETILADAREQAAKEEARILDQARQDAMSERERVQRTLDRERSDALAWIRAATVDNSVEIAGHLLKDLLPDAADGILLGVLGESLVDHAGKLVSESAKTKDKKGRLQVVLSMPRALSEDESRILHAALSEAIGSPFEFVFREDESLLVGPVLRIGDQVLDASLAGHLAILRERAHKLADEGVHDV